MKYLSLSALVILACTFLFSTMEASSAQSSARDREREARERTNRTPDKIRDNRDGRTREIKPLSKRDRENLNECVTLMIIGRSVPSGNSGFKSESKRLKIQGHDFKCKGMYYTKKMHRRVEMSGQLSRHLRARPDDQANYSFTLSDDGTVDAVKVRYKGIVTNITSVVKGGTTSTTNLSKTGKGWKGTANLVIGTLVKRLNSSVKLAKSNRSRGRYEWGISRFGKGQFSEIELTNKQNRPIYCEQKCSKNRQCKAWTFTGGHQFKPKCQLMRNINSAVISREQRVSGLARRR